MYLPDIDMVDGSVFNHRSVEWTDDGTYQVEVSPDADEIAAFVSYLGEREGYVAGEDYEEDELEFTLPIWLTNRSGGDGYDECLPTEFEVWAPTFDCGVQYDPTSVISDTATTDAMYAFRDKLVELVNASLPVAR